MVYMRVSVDAVNAYVFSLLVAYCSTTLLMSKSYFEPNKYKKAQLTQREARDSLGI